MQETSMGACVCVVCRWPPQTRATSCGPKFKRSQRHSGEEKSFLIFQAPNSLSWNLYYLLVIQIARYSYVCSDLMDTHVCAHVFCKNITCVCGPICMHTHVHFCFLWSYTVCLYGPMFADEDGQTFGVYSYLMCSVYSVGIGKCVHLFVSVGTGKCLCANLSLLLPSMASTQGVLRLCSSLLCLWDSEHIRCGDRASDSFC